MIRVANVIEDGRMAGPQVRIATVGAKLKVLGIQTTVIYPTQESVAFTKRLDAEGVAHHSLPIRRLARGWRNVAAYLIFFPWELWLLWRLFRREGYDVVHCSGGVWQVKGVLAARLASVPVVWHLNDTLLPERLRPLFLRICEFIPTGFIVAGQRVYRHYFGEKIPAVPVFEVQAPVDCHRFDPDTVEIDAVRLGEPGIHVVTVANLNPLKGVEYFVEMASELNKRFEKIHFHVVGPVFDSQSDYHRRLQQLVEKHGLINIHFHGAVQDVRGLLKAADIYVCSSISEASPISVWEAMAMGKAIVSTDVGDVARYVENGISGFVTPSKDVSALAKAVGSFVQEPELRRCSGEAARRVVLEHLDLSVCVESHARAYGEIYSRSQRFAKYKTPESLP